MRADIVLSICPPHAALDVARAAAGFRGLYCDANAVSPATTREVAAVVEAGGATFVDGGIVGGPPTEPGTRLYLSGGAAADVAALFAGTALEPVVLGSEIGAASALKMCYAGWSKALGGAAHRPGRGRGRAGRGRRAPRGVGAQHPGARRAAWSARAARPTRRAGAGSARWRRSRRRCARSACRAGSTRPRPTSSGARDARVGLPARHHTRPRRGRSRTGSPTGRGAGRWSRSGSAARARAAWSSRSASRRPRASRRRPSAACSSSFRPRSSSSRSGWRTTTAPRPGRALALVAPPRRKRRGERPHPGGARVARRRGRAGRADRVPACGGRAHRRRARRRQRRVRCSSTAPPGAARPRSTCRRARRPSSAGSAPSSSCPRSR